MLCEPTRRWWSEAQSREIDASELSPFAALRQVLADPRQQWDLRQRIELA